jgi:hypothetical protein
MECKEMKYVMIVLMFALTSCSPLLVEDVIEAIEFKENAVRDEIQKNSLALDRNSINIEIYIDLPGESGVVLDSDFWVWPGPAFTRRVLEGDPHEMVFLPIVQKEMG